MTNHDPVFIPRPQVERLIAILCRAADAEGEPQEYRDAAMDEAERLHDAMFPHLAELRRKRGNLDSSI